MPPPILARVRRQATPSASAGPGRGFDVEREALILFDLRRPGFCVLAFPPLFKYA
jgi:hypothetical protein